MNELHPLYVQIFNIFIWIIFCFYKISPIVFLFCDDVSNIYGNVLTEKLLMLVQEPVMKQFGALSNKWYPIFSIINTIMNDLYSLLFYPF